MRQYSALDERRRHRLRQCTQVLVGEKYWEGCSGLQVTDEIRVTIAAQAALLLLGWNDRYFDHLKSILVYPHTYLVPDSTHLPGGVVLESTDMRLGEAWYGGPVILSWSNVNRAGHPGQEGRNVVLHEFAHVLDQSDEFYDGTPELESAEQYDTWRDVMTAEFQTLRRAARRGRPTLLDKYGAENEAEFFAVATECFFEQPAALSRRHERLYNLLCGFYRQDPATWGV